VFIGSKYRRKIHPANNIAELRHFRYGVMQMGSGSIPALKIIIGTGIITICRKYGQR
jgi:hypothetical protein